MNLETIDPWAQRILSALLNGSYQGLLLTLAVAVALAVRGMPPANAATRHAVWFVTLLLVALLPVLHAARDLASASPATERATGLQPRLSPREIFEPANRGSAVLQMDSSLSLLPVQDSEFRETTIDEDFGTREEEKPLFVDGEPVVGTTVLEEQAGVPALTGTRSWRFFLPSGWSIALVAGWLGIAGIRLVALGGQLWRLRSLKRRATAAPVEWQALFVRAAVDMGLKRPIRLALAADVSTPMVIGLGRPTVVLPATGFERVSNDQLQQVLRHELGHIVRGDDWSNLVQQVIRAVLFFHPAVGWVSRRLTLEREVACDDHVLAASGSPKAYALLLTEFAGRMPGRDFAAAPAAWNHQTQLKERILMILDSKRNTSPRLVGVRLAALTAATLALTGMALNAAPRVSLTTNPDSGAEVAVVTDVTVDDLMATEVSPNVSTTEPALVIASEGATSLTGSSGLTVSRSVTLPSPVQVVSGPKVKKALVASVESVPPPPVPIPNEIAPPVHPPIPHHDSSLEQRLDRLERLVNQLLSRTSGTKGTSPDSYGRLSEQQLAKISAEAERSAHEALNREEKVARLRLRANQDAERARERVEHQAVEIERMVRAQVHGQGPDPVSAHREMLESRRRALEAQMEALEAEMEKLEEAQEERQELREKTREKVREKSREAGRSSGKAVSSSQNQNDSDGIAPQSDGSADVSK